MITSRQNPRIKEFMQLAKKSKDGRVLVEGVHLLKEVLASDIHVECVILAPRNASEEVQEVCRGVESRGIEIVEVNEDCYRKFSQLKSSESVAFIYKFAMPDADSFIEKGKRYVVLDNIQDPGNAGAIIRIAEAAGIDGCIFIGGAALTNGKFLRATMGAVFRVPAVSMEREVFIECAKANNMTLLATELDDTAKAFKEVDYSVADRSIGICFGSEGRGVSRELLSFASERIYIPMAGRVESLNVAVAAGIVLYYVGFDS